MLSNFKKICKGKIGIKVLATTLALMLMLSDFSILGSCLISSFTSYAVESNLENQTEVTNSENVVFQAYFLDEDGNKVFEQSKDMQETLKLYITVGVKNNGYLKNAKIEFLDNNFSSDGSKEMKEISLGTINAGSTITLKNNGTQEEGIDVKPVNAKAYSLENLSKASKIKLTGEYYNAEKAIQIDSERFVKVNWNSSKLADNSDLLKTEQKLITNAILKLKGEEKRVIQVDVKSYLENNSYPVNNTKLNIKIPKINNEYIEPETITVVSYETLATNGKASYEFTKLGESEKSFGTWNYDGEIKEIEINVNNKEDENKNIYWGKGKDEFVITYVYGKDVEVETFEEEVKAQVNLYTGKTLNGENKIEEVSNIIGTVDILVEVPEKIYKKDMNMVKTTKYSESWNVGISNLNLARMTILMDKTVLKQEDSEIDVKYVRTKVNKQDFINLLGEDGGIEIYDVDNEKQIGEISLEGQVEDDEYLTFEYSEEYKQIGFCFIPGENVKVDGGKLKIEHEKEIPAINKEFVSNFNEVTSLLGGYVGTIEEDKTEKIMDLTSSVITIKLEEPTTKANFGMDFGRNDKETLPVNQENEINFTVVLKTAEEQYKLFNNPTIKIDLPDEIEEIKLEDVNLLNANGLEVLNKEVIGKSIYVTLNGNQEETADLTKVDTYVQIKATVKTNENLPTIKRNIKLTVTNGEDIVEGLQEITLEQIEKGLIVKNDVKVEEKSANEDGKIEIKMNANAVTANVTETLINNSDENIAKTEIIGNLAEKGKIRGTLKSEVALKTVMYNEEENVAPQVYYSIDGENWTENFEGATKYKIVLENGILPKEKIEVTYLVEVPENLKTNEELDLYYTVKIEGKEEIKSNVITLATPENTESIEESPFEVKFELKQGFDNIKVGSEIRYLITIKNTSNKQLNNIKIENIMPEELVYEELGYHVNREQVFSKTEEGKYVSPEFTLKPKEEKQIYIHSIIVKYNQNGLTNKITLKWNENGKEKSTTKEDLRIIEEPANIRTTLNSISSGKEIEDKVEYVSIVENIGDKAATAYLSLILSSNLVLDRIEIIKENNEVIIVKDNLINLFLQPGETITLKIFAIADKEKAKEDKNAYAYLVLNNLGLEKQTEKILNTIKVDKIIEEKQETIDVEEKTLKEQDKVAEEKKETKGKEKTKGNVTGEEISGETIKTDKTQTSPDTQKEQNKVETFSISGTAWVDGNQDGLKDSSEKLLKGVLVKIKKIDSNKKEEYVKTKSGETLQAITDNNGKYEFKDLEKGNYVVEFEYNSNDYSLTPISNKASKAILVKEENKTTVKTDTIKLEKSKSDINIGLVLNDIFDLELNKYISKVTIKTNKGTTENIYNRTKLAKAEIKANQMKNAVVMVEYEIEVVNKGEVTANSILLADYAPKDLKFTSELNTTWYQVPDGTLYCTDLVKANVKPGEAKTVKLVLTKTMTETNTGIVNNTAEIAEAHNDFGLVDVNSTPANKQEKENDFSNAEIIISTATGSTSMYIGIVIISMLILGGGIYLINKKVILEKDI